MRNIQNGESHDMNIYDKAKEVVSKSYNEINVGDEATLTHTVTNEDVVTFAELTGDVNPIHLDDEFAKESLFKGRIAHGMLTAGFISTILGTTLPGTNTIYLAQNLKFTAPVRIGDTITAVVKVIDKRDDKKIMTLETNVLNEENKKVIEGSAVVMKME